MAQHASCTMREKTGEGKRLRYDVFANEARSKLIDHTGYENVFCEACPRVVCEICKGAVTHMQTVSKFRVSVRFRVGCCDAHADSFKV